MTFGRRFVALAFAIAGVVVLASCGSDDEATTAAAGTEDTVEEEASSEAASGDGDEEDHDDEEDHGDEDHDDHGDEDHGDEDHDDHGDEDHDDHGDQDHDDHGDEDHDDEDHDDHGDDDHDHDHDEESSSGLGAHEHGVAELFIAWSEGEMVIDLVSPAFNIVGFENEPATDEEQDLFDDRTEALAAPGIIAVNEEASCTLADDVLTEIEFEGSHSEITTSWSLVCDNPDEISYVETEALFAEFPNLEDIDAEWASDADQSSAELTPGETRLSLTR